jgi:hypothetical protein
MKLDYIQNERKEQDAGKRCCRTLWFEIEVKVVEGVLTGFVCDIAN